MRKFIIKIIILILLVSGTNVMADEDHKTSEKPVITDEDKEIAEILEMLKLMEILKEMELIKDYDLFAEEETDEKEN